MAKEFNLSEKINTHTCDKSWHEWISPKDVKEFIKQLKDETKKYQTCISIINLFEKIDKLAGEKLI